MDRNELILRTRKFGSAIIIFTDNIPYKRSVDVVCRQLIRSATSVGANYRSACRAKSMPDFICKLKIAEEEADETIHWLQLLVDSNLIEESKISHLINEANELTAIMTASGKTAKSNLCMREQSKIQNSRSKIKVSK